MWMRPKYDPFDLFEASGFTLLEVMVAVAIIAIALVAALGSQSQGVKLAGETKFATVGAFLAQSKLAELELQAAEDLSSDSGDFGDDFPGYKWRTEVSEGLPLGGLENISKYIKKITLIVFRPDVGGYEHRFSFYRYFPETD
jgi:general secretion pathway protein I